MYILGVVVLLKACDVTIMAAILDFTKSRIQVETARNVFFFFCFI